MSKERYECRSWKDRQVGIKSESYNAHLEKEQQKQTLSRNNRALEGEK